MVLKAPLEHTNFNLDVSGVAGFLGGEEWLAANSSKQLMRHRRWLGWYNSPGSYYIAKKYGTLAKSRLWNGIFPGPPVDPATMLEFDSKEGPRYMGVHSTTRREKTGHLAYLIARYCEQMDSEIEYPFSNNYRVPLPVYGAEPSANNEGATPNGIARVDKGLFSVTIVDLDTFVKWRQYPNVPEEWLLPFEFYGILVSLATVAGGVVSALWGDWYSFTMIFLGAISSGVSSYVLGSGILALQFPQPSQSSPPGDGILVTTHNIIVLKGNENSVNNIIRGRYHVNYAGAPKYRDIGLSSIILTLQFLFQLFLLPQGQLIGQIMFLGTFIISWCFNAYLASLDCETLQTEVLFKTLDMGPKPKFEKLYFSKWSTAAAFVAFYTHPITLTELLSNEAGYWAVWRDLISMAWSDDYDPADMLEVRQGRKKISTLDAEGQRFVREFMMHASEAYRRAKSLKIRDEAKRGRENV